MKRLIIQNFGPINNIDIELDKPINVIIGAQASGKSTLARIIYFCRKTRDHLVGFLLNSYNFVRHPNDLYISFLKSVRKAFMGCFGTTKHLEKFTIKYYFNTEKDDYIYYYLEKDNYVKVIFSNRIKTKIQSLLKEAYTVYSSVKTTSSLSFLERYNEESQLLFLNRKHFIDETNILFNDDCDIIYVPAGRSILSTFSEQLFDVNVTSMDSTMQEFINIIRSTRSKFNVPLHEYVKNYTKFISGQINNTEVGIAISLITGILKGNYVCDKDGEKIYFADGKWVKLMFASSGQQESLWMLMLMFSYILENKKAFVVLEEPEAHLYPEAQKNIVELIALFCNASNSSILITTHSPYILSSFNLLIHSYKVENNKKLLSEEKVVPKQCRVNPNDISCSIIEALSSPNLRTIMDEDMKMINSFEIDNVSEIINTLTDKLLNWEDKYDL